MAIPAARTEAQGAMRPWGVGRGAKPSVSGLHRGRAGRPPSHPSQLLTRWSVQARRHGVHCSPHRQGGGQAPRGRSHASFGSGRESARRRAVGRTPTRRNSSRRAGRAPGAARNSAEGEHQEPAQIAAEGVRAAVKSALEYLQRELRDALQVLVGDGRVTARDAITGLHGRTCPGLVGLGDAIRASGEHVGEEGAFQFLGGLGR